MSDHAIREEIQTAVSQVHSELVEISEDLSAHPELGWSEYRSSALLAEFLSKHGFGVEHPYLDLPTAFRAKAGDGKFTVGFLAEYDALPGLGHACGHNLIAAMSMGAAIGLAAVADQLNVTVEVIGTPAEEGGGGKIELLDRGAFEELALAMMAHPAPADAVEAKPFAVTHWHVQYEGRAAHAAAYPEKGENANDAFLIAQQAIALLRQQLPAEVRVHGIMTNAGQAPNAIPELTEGRWYVRANSTDELIALEEKVQNCFKAGEIATGTKLTITPESKRYSEMHTDKETLEAYRQNALRLGRNLDTDPTQMTMTRASTDMGNVSRVVNAIHPYIGVGGTASNHQAEFAQSCVGEQANQTLFDGATALAWTGADMACERS